MMSLMNSYHQMVITDGDKTLFLDVSSRSSIGRDVD